MIQLLHFAMMKNAQIHRNRASLVGNSLVKTSCQPPHQFHLNCIPDEWFELMLMQRKCCVCYQPKLQLFRCDEPLAVDVCKSGDLEALEKILGHNPDIAHSDLHLICHAADNGSSDCVRLLLDNGVNINVKNINGNTALHLAAQKGHTGIVKTLLEVDRSLAKDRANDGNMAHHLAAFKGHAETVRLLSEIDTSLAKEEDGDGNIALHLAALQGHTETTEALLEIDRSLVEVGDYYGNTALHLAARKGHTKTVEVLLYYGSLVNGKNDNGITALDLAVLYGKTETVEVLLKFDPSLANDESNAGRRATPLHFAAEKGYEECLKLLIRVNANINATDEKRQHTIVLRHHAWPYRLLEIAVTERSGSKYKGY